MTWDDLTAEERMTWDLGLGVRALGEDADDAVACFADRLIDAYRRGSRYVSNHDAWAMALRDFLARRRAGSPGG